MGQRVHDKADHYIQHGNRKKLKLHLKKHPDLCDSNDATLIFTAIWHNRGMVKWLLEKGVSANTQMGEGGNTPLMEAAAAGDVPLVELLLEFKADPNALNEDNENPLGFAVTWQQPEIVKILVAAGADVNNTDDSGDGKTQLDWAELSGWTTVVDALISVGAKRYVQLYPNA